VNCYGVIAPVQAWLFVNSVFDTRQARRLFGLVAAGGSLGNILAGLLARTLVKPLGGTDNLMLVLAVLIACAAVTVNVAWKIRRPDLHAVVRRPAPFVETLGLIGRTRYLRLIACLIALVAIVTLWTQFQFQLAMDERFARGPKAALVSARAAREAVEQQVGAGQAREADVAAADLRVRQAERTVAGATDRITEFSGAFNFYMGLLAFLLQLVLTGPALRRFGIGLTILLLPLSLGVGSVFILLWPRLWTVMMTNGFDQGLRFSVDKATFELLYMPVDSRIKNDVKSTIDLVINRVADAVAGILLGLATQGFSLVIFTVPGLGLGVRGIAALSLVGVGLWLVVAQGLKRGYIDQIRESIQRNRLEVERAAVPILDRSTVELLAGKISGGNADDILFALEVFSSQHKGALHPAVHGLLRHPEPRLRLRAIELLDDAADVSAAPEVERLLRDPEIEVRTAAMLYLAHHTGADPLERITELGPFADFSIQAGIIAFLSRPGADRNVEAARVMLEQMIADHGPAGRRSRQEAARLIGRIPDFDDLLVRLIDEPDPEVVREAMLSAGRRANTALAPKLVAQLGTPLLGAAAAEALVAMGAPVTALLGEALVDERLPIEARCEIPPVLAQIGTTDAQQVLMSGFLQRNDLLRFRVIQALNKLRIVHPEVPLDRGSIEALLGAEILGHYQSYRRWGIVGAALESSAPIIAGLQAQMEQERERIFRLMGLLWPEIDLKSVWVALQSNNAAQRADAIELLEAELSPDLRKLVLPLFDDEKSVADRVAIANEQVGSGMTGAEEQAMAARNDPASQRWAVSTLLSSDDPWLLSCGVHLVGALRLLDFADEVHKHVDSSDPLLRETARSVLMRLRAPIEPPHEVLVSSEEGGWEPHHGEAGVG
jgi:AAA family ATP:ADP antiporter